MAKKFNDLLNAMGPERRARVEAGTQEILREMLLEEIRKMAGMTQTEAAEALGIQQSVLSKMEKQSNMEIDTLRRIIEAYGGSLELIARLPQGDVRLSQFTN